MSRLALFSAASSGLSEYIPNLEQAYIILVVVVPIMIAQLLLIVFMMLVSIWGVSQRIKEVRDLLEFIFSDKLKTLDDDSVLSEEMQIKTERSASDELDKVKKPAPKARKVLFGVLAALIPILLAILILVS